MQTINKCVCGTRGVPNHFFHNKNQLISLFWTLEPTKVDDFVGKTLQRVGVLFQKKVAAYFLDQNWFCEEFPEKNWNKFS